MSGEMSGKLREGCDMPTPHAGFMSPDGERAAGTQRPCALGGHGESAVVITGADGTVRYVSTNYESLCGYSRYEILGRSVRELRSGRRDAAFFRAVEDVLRSGQAWTGTFSASRADGSPWLESVTICPVTDASGAVSHCVGVRRDETGSDLREEAIGRSRAMEAIARLAAGLAHNYNNLLTSIIGYSDLLLLRQLDDAAARRNVEEIREAGERAAVLTRQLLAFSREQALMPEALDLNALVGILGRELRARWGDVIEIHAGLADDLGTVSADPGQIEQAIVTLAVKAREAMPQGGRLTFITKNVCLDAPFIRDGVLVPPGEYVMLAVSDTGTGMDEDIRDRIFEPFPGTTTNAPGLEVAAVYGIVKQSGGYIWVFSRPGDGTTFEVYLPRVPRAPDALGPVRKRTVPSRGANRLPRAGLHVRRIEPRDAPDTLTAAGEGR